MRHLVLILFSLPTLFVGAASIYMPIKNFKFPEKAEDRIKIAIIDSGLSPSKKMEPYICRNLARSFFKEDAISPFGTEHGTNIATLIAQSIDPRKFCLVIIKSLINNKYVSDNYITAGVEYAIKLKVSFINMSLAGENFDVKEYNALEKALNKGIKIAVASGNDSGIGPAFDREGRLIRKKARIGGDLDKKCNSYPACYNFFSNNFHVVGSTQGGLNDWGGYYIYGNYGSRVKYWENGSIPDMGCGTSLSTAIHTGKWVAGLIK